MRTCVLLTVVLLGSAGAAGAQTITIASGALDLSGGPYTLGAKLTLIGDRGVATSATISPGAGVIEATTCASLPDPHACRPGDALSLRLTQSGTDLPWDPITLDGVPYTQQTGRHFDATSLSVAFAGSVTLPPMTDVAVITAPFSFSGVFRHPAGGTDEDHPVLEQLQGLGTVYVYLRQSFVNSALWQVTRLRYVFQSSSPSTSSTRLTEHVTVIR
jgi:hypothetical protein